MIAITSADTYIAQCIARRILQQKEIQGAQLRLLARDPSRCEELKRLGAQVIQVNYQQEQQIQDAIQQSQWLIVIPEPQENSVQGIENVIRAANKAAVKNVILISNVAAADGQGRILQEIRQIEQRVQTQLQNNWVILRRDWLQQDFLLLSNWVEEKREFALPISQNNKLAPIDANDINNAIIQLISQGQNQVQPVIDDRYNRQTLTLTGPQATNGTEIVEDLKRATRINDIRFREVQRQQFENYLTELGKNRQYNEKVQSQRRLAAQESGRGRQKFGAPFPPNRVEIETILEQLDWVDQGKGDRVSQDLRKIIGEEGQNMQQFFENNTDQFRPRA